MRVLDLQLTLGAAADKSEEETLIDVDPQGEDVSMATGPAMGPSIASQAENTSL